MNYYLDTDICIFSFQGRFPAIRQWMESFSPDKIKIPAIVKAELLLGALKSDNSKHVQEVVEHFLEPFEVIPFCDQAASIYASIRYNLEKLGKPIGPNDLIIASSVLANHGTLVTHNLKEFYRIANLKIEDWTK
ncbi:MAG: type II toxin-antitoxin system VapC family toxin [Elusimicrobia bacterium]|nr:type II toxin-antitoxin system VapC family toxin [Elusimicrobiota bacterium]